MNALLLLSAILTFLGGLSHSISGELLIFKKLKHEHLPTLRQSTEMTHQVLRAFWHIPTLAWWAFAAQIFVLAGQGALDPMKNSLLLFIAVSLLAQASFLTFLTRGRFRPVVILWLMTSVLLVALWAG